MDRNLFLAFALSFAVLVLWTTVIDPPPPLPEDTGEPAATEQPMPTPGTGLPLLEPAESLEPGPTAWTPPSTPVIEGRRIVVDTDLYRAELDTRGASIAHWELKGFRTSGREGEVPIVLTTSHPPYELAMTTPFEELGFGDLGQAVFELEREDGRTFVFRYTNSGVTVRKTFVFRDGSYAFELRVVVENGSTAAIGPRFAVSWPAASLPGNDFREQSLAALHEGSVERELLDGFGSPGFFGGEPTRLVSFSHEVDWAGANTPFFLAAMLPDSPAQASARFVATNAGPSVAQIYYDPVSLPPGQPAERVYRAYIGPKEPERLEAIGGGLIRSIDLGWSWMQPLTRFFLWLLSALYGVVHNYGVAIILLTVLVRLVTTPLTSKQMRSMERMRALSPKLKELKEKHGDDKQKQSEEMMKLYKQEGVNPLGGCLPMILQLPVFIGLFYALRSSIQLRQAPFFGWIDDLSAPDLLFEIPEVGIPLRVLPLLNGATMFAQQRITPTQGMDPAQQKMMTTMMPIVMTVVFYQFASGLVLYWMVSSLLAVAHQLWIGKRLRKN